MKLLPALFLLACLFSLSAQAQDVDENKPVKSYSAPNTGYQGMTGNSIVANPTFRFMAQRALAEQPANFNFSAFRAHYSQTDQYDPAGEETRDQMLKLAYNAQREPDAQKRKKILDNFATLLINHLANLDVVTQAQVLAEEDKRFGDLSFYEWLRSGLIKSVVYSGTGASLTQAYDVITLGEESALMGSLHVRVLKTDTRQSGSTSYTMHLVTDPKHVGPYTIFVDTSIPMDRLAQQKQAKGSTFTLPKR